MRKRAIESAKSKSEKTGKKPVAKNRPATNDPELTKKSCSVCLREFYDTNMYFYGISSKKCFWCSKFPISDLKIIR
jgi:hypothetical protein